MRTPIRYVGTAKDFDMYDKDHNGYLDEGEVKHFNDKNPNSKIKVFPGMISNDYTSGRTRDEVMDAAIKDGYYTPTFATDENAWTPTTDECLMNYGKKRVFDKKHPIIGKLLGLTDNKTANENLRQDYSSAKEFFGNLF